MIAQTMATIPNKIVKLNALRLMINVFLEGLRCMCLGFVTRYYKFPIPKSLVYLFLVKAISIIIVLCSNGC
jgi:hypothetical protein